VKVLALPGRDEAGKFRAVVRDYPGIWQGLVLDVGCRSGGLKGALAEQQARYCGLDLRQPADVIGDVERGLPFRDRMFDTVVALDVLEHTDRIFDAIGELYRVSRRHVLVSLPNVYEVKLRLRFLFGRRLSGKYGLPLRQPRDRHRWLFSLWEARKFLQIQGQRHAFEIAEEGCLIGPRRGFAGGRFLAGMLPNLMAPWYVALFQRKEAG